VDQQRPGAIFDPETFVERVNDDALAPLAARGDFAYVDPRRTGGPRPHVAMQTDSPGRATRVRRMAAGSGRSVPRAGGPRRPSIAVIRTGETTMRAVAVFVGREV